MSGRLPGVQITTPTGILGQTPTINIRGVNSITSGTYPLVVVDGVPTITGNYGAYSATPHNALADINPADIASVEVLKDGSLLQFMDLGSKRCNFNYNQKRNTG